MINWRQLYNESQAIQPEDSSVSTERISRLVNIYKNDLIEQDLHRYTSRLSRFSRSCQLCTPKSYTMIKWLDASISGEKNLFQFRLSGRSVSAIVYYWNKHVSNEKNKRGQISDFKRMDDKDFCISNLVNIDENILIKQHFFISMISYCITRFQMYYTYLKARSLSSSIQVHIQPMKTFRYLFQTNICPIFLCFINEDNNLPQLFWTFRHLITLFNWPSTTKIFSNRSYETQSTFERLMIDSLGFVDFSCFNPNQTELVRFLYRCLKTCQENGPMIFLFDHSTIFKPKYADYHLMSFLCDLIRFDLSIPDLMIIPTCLYKENLSFSQPFSFKELIESFVKKFHVQKHFRELNDDKLVHQFMDCIFRHLGYNANQLVPTRIEFQHVIAAVELCQITPASTVESIHSTLQNLLKTCSFIVPDNHQWNEITEEDIRKYNSNFENIHSKCQLLSVFRKEYFLDIITALTILSKTECTRNLSRIFEVDLFTQLKFLLFTFDYQQYFTLRPCQNLHHIIQHCQFRNYIPPDFIPQKSMKFRDTILSDHEWSDDEDDDDGIDDDEFLDQDENDDEIVLNDQSSKTLDTIKPFYRINYQENLSQLKFFGNLFGSLIEASISILKFHIDQQLRFLTLEGFKSDQIFSFHETSNSISNETLSFVRRAYSYRLMEFSNLFDETALFIEMTDERIYPLSMEKLLSLHDEFVQLFTCLI